MKATNMFGFGVIVIEVLIILVQKQFNDAKLLKTNGYSYNYTF